MAKASAKPVNLGTKRICPKCAAKFYDFAKPEIDCPKCGHEIDLSKPAVVPPPAPVKRTPVAREVEAADSEVSPGADSGSGGDFESLDDLEGDDENIVGDFGKGSKSDSDDGDDSDNY